VNEEKEKKVKVDQSGGGAETDQKARGGVAHDGKQLVLMNCHLDNDTAKTNTNHGGHSRRDCFGEIAQNITKYGASIMAAGFDMSEGSPPSWSWVSGVGRSCLLADRSSLITRSGILTNNCSSEGHITPSFATLES